MGSYKGGFIASTALGRPVIITVGRLKPVSLVLNFQPHLAPRLHNLRGCWARMEVSYLINVSSRAIIIINGKTDEVKMRTRQLQSIETPEYP